MAPQSFQLVVRTGPNPGKVYPLTKDEISLGRDIASDIVLSDPEVSRHHARLVAQGNSFILEDTGSTNGTFVNGQRLMGPHMLRSGELILLGENVSLSFEPAQTDLDATMVASNVPSMPASPPPPRQTYIPPVSPPRQQGPSFSQAPYGGGYPGEPEESLLMEDEEDRQRSRTWLYAGCGCLLVVLCVLVVGAIIFDQMDLYCQAPFNVLFYCP
jgi:pSer/pThr/pTyr-binding forkhead associated (FHA) protein